MRALLTVRRAPVPLTRPYALSFGTIEAFETYYAFVEAEGRTGAGEVTLLPGYGPETADSTAAELTRLGAVLAGGVGVESALADLAGRAPFLASGLRCAFETWELGGAEFFARALPGAVPLCAFCPGQTPEAAADSARRLAEAGYATLKLKVGRLPPAAEAARVRAAAEAAGAGVRLRLDANQGYRFDDALAVGRELEGLAAVELLEQPFGPGQWREHESLAARIGTPLMLDESVWTEADVRRSADCGARLVKLKLCKHPGLAASLRLAELAQGLGLGLVYGNGVQTALGNHLEAWLHRRIGLTTASEANGFLKAEWSPFPHGLEASGGLLRGGGVRLAEGRLREAPELLRVEVDRPLS